MLSWLTGPRITDVIEDLQTDPAYDTTFLEPPETPAPHFAVKAIKHAFFGTPAPEDANANAGKKLDSKPRTEPMNVKATSLPPPKEGLAPPSPSKHINGILMTPGTANKGRKTVSFGSQVVDNEGKKGNTGRSGIPNDCPGKFPSPWTPGTQLMLDVGSDKKPRTKLTEALYDARSTTQARSGQKPKARDDSDITIDLGAPRSESGRYWKEQYETYARKSEKEVKQLLARQQVAKNYAKKKDEEATILINQLSEERKRARNRERDLEQQIKDLQEHLRKATSEKNAANMTIALLNKKVDKQKDSIMVSPLDVPNNKTSFQIFEDLSKDVSNLQIDQEKRPQPRAQSRTRRTAAEPSPESISVMQPTQVPEENKENSPPKSRRPRRQTLPSTRPGSSHGNASRLGTEDALEASALLAKSLERPQIHESLAGPSATLPLKAPLSIRKPEPSRQNIPPKSPAVPLLSSPLPQPSPDANLWSCLDDSPLPQKIDSLAFPISSGPSFSKPSRPAPSSTRAPPRHRASQSVSVSHFQRTEALKATSFAPDKIADPLASRLDALRAGTGPKAVGSGSVSVGGIAKSGIGREELGGVSGARGAGAGAGPQRGVEKFDAARSGLLNVGEEVSYMRKEKEREKEVGRSGISVDRKEEARKRLLERRKKKDGGV
ncbi:spindle pole body formation-associated protein-domain-containing protein [Dendryphion nanum]|uniref:Spindle pole body formation-associated protein-domain-containing protein n=1 Tax=Dendryphion nanum TaxID=256645 RepID=A0A9P9DNM4_9PLEO|nr:spindle pole body formation-associated protein-domain-containing protein [Dendryphion nanum]